MAIRENQRENQQANEKNNLGVSKPEERRSSQGVYEIANELLKTVICNALELSIDKLDGDAPLGDYGLDSVMIMQIIDELEKVFGTLSKTLFFEYLTVNELTKY